MLLFLDGWLFYGRWYALWIYFLILCVTPFFVPFFLFLRSLRNHRVCNYIKSTRKFSIKFSLFQVHTKSEFYYSPTEPANERFFFYFVLLFSWKMISRSRLRILLLKFLSWTKLFSSVFFILPTRNLIFPSLFLLVFFLLLGFLIFQIYKLKHSLFFMPWRDKEFQWIVHVYILVERINNANNKYTPFFLWIHIGLLCIQNLIVSEHTYQLYVYFTERKNVVEQIEKFNNFKSVS